MKAASRAAVVTVLLLSLPGCENKAKTAPPPQAQAPVPVLPPSKMVHVPSLPPLPPPPLGDVAVATDPPENPEPVHPQKPAHHKPSPAKPANPADVAAAQTGDKAAPPSQTQAANAGASEVSPIGQLSSSGEGATSPGRQDIEHLISDTENGLNGIKRALTGDEQTTSTQIKTFLVKAKQALADNDLDGAQTLANKAKVLLEELTKK
jgi:hypothetical protein